MKKEKTIEIKNCQKCNSKFEITDKDLEFYDKISPKIGGEKFLIPTPKLCLECREQRRLSWRNVRKIYMANSSLSGEKVISSYKPNSGYIVFSPNDWWSDKWDGLDYGQDFDFSKTFFEQFNELLHKAPLISSGVLLNTIKNSIYINGANYVKNSYLSFNLSHCESIYYSEGIYYCENVVDSYMLKNSKNCYNCTNSTNISFCFYSNDLVNSNNCFFCKDSINLDNCIGCINLFNKKYHIFNKAYSKEKYEEKKKELLKDINLLKQKVDKFFLTQIRKENHNISSENVSGEYIINSKNCENCYVASDCENIKNCFLVNDGCYNSYDISWFGNKIYNSYEGVSIGINTDSCYFCFGTCSNVSNLIYCHTVMNSSKNCFGCVGLKNKEYCILNKEYSKEEYEKLVPKIIKHMQKTGEWGEFFPSSISPYGYNESGANEYYPLKKENALKQGFNWSDYEAPFPKVEKIIPAKLLPESINDIPDDILNWAIECEETKKPFRIIKQELEFYRKHNLPIPRKHPDVRHLERLALRNPRKLYDRKCDKCEKEIKTTYSSNRSEIVYCEECYLKEVM